MEGGEIFVFPAHAGVILASKVKIPSIVYLTAPPRPIKNTPPLSGRGIFAHVGKAIKLKRKKEYDCKPVT